MSHFWRGVEFMALLFLALCIGVCFAGIARALVRENRAKRGRWGK